MSSPSMGEDENVYMHPPLYKRGEYQAERSQKLSMGKGGLQWPREHQQALSLDGFIPML